MNGMSLGNSLDCLPCHLSCKYYVLTLKHSQADSFQEWLPEEATNGGAQAGQNPSHLALWTDSIKCSQLLKGKQTASEDGFGLL